MQAAVRTATVVGVQAVPVEVQADVASGLPCFTIVGLGDAAVMEARDRVRSALRAAGFEFPTARVTVNLAPAPLRKHGTGFDLPVAIAILRAVGQLPRESARPTTAVGELGLDGSLRPVPGLLAYALDAHRHGLTLVGPHEITEISPHLPDLSLAPVGSLSELRTGASSHPAAPRTAMPSASSVADLSEVVGHECAKRALEIAASGGHNLLFIGPPGSGKTMLARRLPGILPPLSASERLDTALVHSVAGLDESPALAGVRPFRAPHHTASVAGLAGGGSPPRPGEVSLAHNGVLFLDELPEFGPAALQSLRQPLEDGVLTLVRAEGRIRYPARFTLLAAMNPCPCGYFGDPDRECTCSTAQRDRYRNRVGGPLLDRVDMSLQVCRPDPKRLLAHSDSESSASVAQRVCRARAAVHERGAGETPLAGARLLAACQLAPGARRLLERDAVRRHMTGRAVTRLLRVARTIADLEGCSAVGSDHLAEAMSYRMELE